MRSLRIILILAGKQLRVLSRMPAILLVIFVPGIVMYTVFTKIFEGPAGVGRPFRVAVVDQDDTEQSRNLIEALSKSHVKIVRTVNEEEDGPLLTVESARRLIRKKGKFRVAVVIPKGFGQAPNVLAGDRHKGVRLIYDETQPIESNAVVGLLQMAAGRQLSESASRLVTTVGMLLGRDRSQRRQNDTAKDGSQADKADMLIKVEKVGVAIQRMKIASKHTFLAGIVPLFLLFSATGAARGMIEEMDGGEVTRLLVAPITPAHLVIGNMLTSLVVAMLQCYGMYAYAWLVFGVAIWEIAGGLFVLTLATTLATTGFGMLLGSLCRTTQQLDSIGTVVILAMSAIGGSMVPRFIMPPFMQKMGLFTINGWAYDGFIALIRAEGVPGILDESGVLLGMAAFCLATASIILSRRLRVGLAR